MRSVKGRRKKDGGRIRQKEPKKERKKRKKQRDLFLWMSGCDVKDSSSVITR
jgi:hypothetical protein